MTQKEVASTGWSRRDGYRALAGARAPWRVRLLWLALLAIPLLLSASQPLSPEDMKLVKRAEETYGPRAGKRVTSWRTLAMQNKAAGLTDRQKLEKVNQFFNQMRFIDDIKLWHKKVSNFCTFFSIVSKLNPIFIKCCNRIWSALN